MMTRSQTIITMLALVLTAPVASAQYNSNPRNCPTGGCSLNGVQPTNYRTPSTDYSASNGYNNTDYGYSTDFPAFDRYQPSSYDSQPPLSRVGQDLRGQYLHEMSRLQNGYDYRAPLDSAVDDSFRRPVTYDYPDRGRDLDYGRREYDTRDYGSSDYRNDNDIRGRLTDPFRLPSSTEREGSRTNRHFRYAPMQRDYQADSGYQSRRRIPLDRIDYSNYSNDYRPLDQNRFDVPSDNYGSTDYDYNNSLPPRNDQTQPGLDPFTPPLPRRDAGETEAIYKEISVRYGNPVNVRAVQAMTPTQSLALFREVSQQTDQRHLEPSNYDLRVRRGIRNLGIALENPTFKQSLGVQADSFRIDGFRTTLSRIADSMRVANYNDAQRVMQTVMQEAQNVPGLTANVVAFEFANATIDTLDKFSALEPNDPGRGASLDLERAEKVRSAMLESEIVGIGVEVKLHDNGLLIMKALRGGPAAEAGLQSGDIITAIDGRSIDGAPMASSVDLMKGGQGSRIRLRIVRNGSRGSDVNLVRRKVRVYTVNDVRMQPGTDKVAYISLSQFGQKSTEELDQALQQMHSQGMKSLIVDLRGNPGGLLNVCVDITNRFQPCGTIVSTKGRLSSDNMLETASYSRTWNTPLVVLIDGDSASASEIFAAAVQDNKRGIVVGEKSYGKGTVQTHFPLNSINGNLRLTTARFYSPSGRPMSGQGVTPDVRIADADGPANGDRVLNDAIRIAQSQQLKDLAQAAARCKPTANQPLQRNSFRKDNYDGGLPQIVLR